MASISNCDLVLSQGMQHTKSLPWFRGGESREDISFLSFKPLFALLW